MSEIEKYYNGEIIVDFEEETELEKKYNEVAELYSKAVKKKIEYRKEIERLNKELQDTKEHLGEYLYEQEEENKKLKNIIKEVREFVEKWKYADGDGSVYFDMNTNPDDLLGILDKGE